MAAPIPIKCVSCRKSIKKQHDSILALQQTWHKDCFRCSICKTRVEETFFSRKNTLYCRQHYLENYAHCCHKCFQKVTGLVMISGDVSFHPECFRCMKCRCVIGHGDNYVFEERSQLYCADCYEVDIGKYMKYKEFKTFHKGAIHQVHISPSKIKKRQLSFKYKEALKENMFTGLQKKLTSRNKASRVSIISSEEDSSLVTGDTVLEINGIPINSNNIKQFSELLESTDSSKRISVTIERVLKSDETVSSSHQPDDNTTDPAIYQRNMSYFNFSFFKRSDSEASVMKQKVALRNLKPVKENSLDGLSDRDRQKLNRINEPLQKTRIRSKSLGDIEISLADDDRFLIKRGLLKAESPLHRAQSFKVEVPLQNQIFRPADLEFGEIIGQGFFGEVIKISHKITGKEMVLKKLNEIEDEALEQFLKEVHVLKSLKHPNVLQFVGIMYKDTVLHIILEYIQGGTLRRLLKHKHIELPWKKKIQLAKDIAVGMNYLHGQNVMHRDLKSKNVLIKKKEGGYTAVVADFGLVSVMHETLPFSRTSSQVSRDFIESPISPRPNFKKRCTVVGSPYWMAPEIYIAHSYDESVDVFSYGIVLCEIISRLSADPDEIPRSNDYGLDVEAFKKKVDSDYPEVFFKLTVACCSLKPEERFAIKLVNFNSSSPPFCCCEKWLDALLTNIEFEIPLPEIISFLSEPKPLRLRSLSKTTRDRKVARKISVN